MINERWDGTGWLWRLYLCNLPKENQEKQQQMRHSSVLLPVASMPTTCRYAGWGTLWSLGVSRGTSSLGDGGQSIKLWALQLREAEFTKYTRKLFSSFRTMMPTSVAECCFIVFICSLILPQQLSSCMFLWIRPVDWQNCRVTGLEQAPQRGENSQGCNRLQDVTHGLRSGNLHLHTVQPLKCGWPRASSQHGSNKTVET